jgi:pheromone alpha factor receptor
MSVTATADQSAGFVHNATFDPYTQMITIVMPDGTTQTEVDISSIFSLQTATVDTAIIYGVQLGVSVLLMMILAVMTRPEKRRSIIFFLNVCALLFLFIRGVLMCIILHGPYYNFYNWITAWYWDVAHDQRISISGEVLNFLAYVAMESSLFFQVRIVCCTLRTSWRLAVTALTCLVAVAVCAIRFTMMVLNIKIGVIGADTATDAEWDMLNNVAASTNIVIIVSIIFFSLLFVGKLGHAIQQRRSMGMKQFGPMQIIFVMGCQTMFIPGESSRSSGKSQTF